MLADHPHGVLDEAEIGHRRAQQRRLDPGLAHGEHRLAARNGARAAYAYERSLFRVLTAADIGYPIAP